MGITWNPKTKEIFDKVISNLPQFHRSIAEQLVKEKAQEIAAKRNADTVENEDLIKAFFQEVPPAFKEMMKRLFVHLKIDHTEFINDKKEGIQE